MNLTRRTVLIGTTALSGCAGTSVGTSPVTTSETDLLLVDNSALQIANEFQPPNETLIASLKLAGAGLTALLSGGAPLTGAATPSQIVGIVGADMNALAPLVDAAFPSLVPYVIAAQVLLATASGLLGIAVTVPAPHAVAHPIPNPDDARALLKAYTGTK